MAEPTQAPPPGCDPVGIADIADRLKVRRQTAAVWKARGLLPPPPWTVSGQPAWNWPEIETWARRTGRFHEPEMRIPPGPRGLGTDPGIADRGALAERLEQQSKGRVVPTSVPDPVPATPAVPAKDELP